MRHDPREKIKDTISGILSYYGIRHDIDYEPEYSTETVDIVGFIEADEFPDMAIAVELTPTIQKDFKRMIRTPSLKWIFIIAPDEYVSVIEEELKPKRPPQNKQFAVFPIPTQNSLRFEDRIREVTGHANLQRYFAMVKDTKSSESIESEVLNNFERMIKNEGLSIYKAKDLVYKAAVGGMSTLSGKSVGHFPDIESYEREKDLPREAIFLAALGILKEEERKERTMGTEQGSAFYLTLSDSEEAIKLAAEVVDEKVELNRREIKKIMNQYPRSFNFIILTGSLGIFTPKPIINIERQRPFSSGVIRTTYQYEKTELVELIRTIINTLDIEVNEWNRINCLASFLEIRNLVSDYFEKFEKIGIAVRGYRGARKLYLPLKTIARFLNLSNWKDSYDKDKLKEFSLYDALLRTLRNDRDIYERIKDLDISEDEVRSVLSESMKLGITSHLLPKGSTMPFAIYKQQKFGNFCLERMRSAAEDLLEITW